MIGNGVVRTLFRSLSPPEAVSAFHATAVEGSEIYYAARDGQGRASLLVRASGERRAVPMRLAGIEAQFGVTCELADSGASARTEILSVITCVDKNERIEDLFASVAESLIPVMGARPTITGVAAAVEQLVALFQELRRPAKRSLVGLIGELCLIFAARDALAAIRAWRIDPNERYDFVVESVRLDAKATAGGRAVHGLSFEQANPPIGTRGLIFTLRVDQAGGGTSLLQLLSLIESRLNSDSAAVSRLWSVVAETLGETLPLSLGWQFDLQCALSSLAIYDAAMIPAIRPPLPVGVSGVRFDASLQGVSQIDLAQLCQSLSPAEAQLLPLSYTQ